MPCPCLLFFNPCPLLSFFEWQPERILLAICIGRYNRPSRRASNARLAFFVWKPTRAWLANLFMCAPIEIRWRKCGGVDPYLSFCSSNSSKPAQPVGSAPEPPPAHASATIDRRPAQKVSFDGACFRHCRWDRFGINMGGLLCRTCRRIISFTLQVPI